MKNKSSNKKISFCEECKSEYYSDSSEMENLCPECAHYLYGADKCRHAFENNRCTKCFWNGNRSSYILTLKGLGEKIMETIHYFQNKYGRTNIVVKDYWPESEDAIGLADRAGDYLVYIAVNAVDENYFVSLENPSEDNKMPYAPAGEFDGLSLEELEEVVVRHLKI